MKDAAFENSLTHFAIKCDVVAGRIPVTQGLLKENCRTVRNLGTALTDTPNSFAKQTLSDIELKSYVLAFRSTLEHVSVQAALHHQV